MGCSVKKDPEPIGSGSFELNFWWNEVGTIGWGANHGGSPCDYTTTDSGYGKTDCFAPRHQEGGNTVMVDGHAKYLKTGTAASGTNYNASNPNFTGPQACVLDYSKYRWDPRYDTGVEHNADGTQHCP